MLAVDVAQNNVWQLKDQLFRTVLIGLAIFHVVFFFGLLRPLKLFVA